MKNSLTKTFITFCLFLFSFFLQAQTKFYEIREIPTASKYEIDYWNWVNNDLMGIEGYTENEQYIGRFPAAKFLHDNWRPIDGFKHILKGKLTKLLLHTGEFHKYELDFNFFVKPSNRFEYLINFNLFQKPDPRLLFKLHPHYINYPNLRIFENDTIDEWHREKDPISKIEEYRIESEITTHEQFSYENPIFRFKNQFIWIDKEQDEPGSAKNVLNNTLCFYGPWVGEYLHDLRPEIHPSEIIWWNSNDSAAKNVFILKDNTGYFNSRVDFFISDTQEADVLNWRPWNDSMVNAVINLAYHIPKDSVLLIVIKDMFENDAGGDHLIRNVEILPSAIKTSYLTFKNQSLIKVHFDTISLARRIHVSYNKIFMLSDSSKIGFITLRTKVGKEADTKEIKDGYLGFEIVSKYTKEYNLDVKDPIPITTERLRESNIPIIKGLDTNTRNIVREVFRLLCKTVGNEQKHQDYFNIANKWPHHLNTYEISDTNYIKYRIVNVFLQNILDTIPPYKINQPDLPETLAVKFKYLSTFFRRYHE